MERIGRRIHEHEWPSTGNPRNQGHQLDELRADLKAIASEFDNIGTKFQGASLAKLILQPKKLMEAIEPLSQLIAKHSGPSA